MIPAVSVVLPFRNAARYLVAALESILNQTFIDFELLAINDGSDDGSPALVRAIALRDPRVRLLETTAPGLPSVLNTGVAEARGRYVARMDGDDIALPQRLAAQVAAMERDPRLLAVGSAVDQIDAAGRMIETAWYPCSPASIRAELRNGRCCLCHPATMIRREALVAVGGYRTMVALSEDLDLWLRLIRVGDLRNLDRRLLRYRLHGANASFQRTRLQIRSILRSIVLDREDLDAAQRASIEACTNLETLVRLWRPDHDAAAAFLDLTGWYVENAALAGEDRVARRLAAQLATLAPGGRPRWIERCLRQLAALAAASRGRRLAALRHLIGRGHDRNSGFMVWRALLSPPTLNVQSEDPGPATAASGYLDQLKFCAGGTSLVLRGWLPVHRRALPRDIALVLPCAARSMSFRLVQRPDVAHAHGACHLYAGFRILVALERPLDFTHERARVWSRSPPGPWQPLHDEAVLIDPADS